MSIRENGNVQSFPPEDAADLEIGMFFKNLACLSGILPEDTQLSPFHRFRHHQGINSSQRMATLFPCSRLMKRAGTLLRELMVEVLQVKAKMWITTKVRSDIGSETRPLINEYSFGTKDPWNQIEATI